MDYLQYIYTHIIYLNISCLCFKPYYKWITFNTFANPLIKYFGESVLNLIINGLPSIRLGLLLQVQPTLVVLNLIINGLPSIRL